MRLTWRRMAANEIDHERLWALAGLVALPLGMAVARTIGEVPLRCPFKALTGWPCLTCGSSRALDALAHANVSNALRLNPLVTALMLGWAAFVPYGLVAGRSTSGRRLRLALSAREGVLVRIAALVVIAATWCFLLLDGR